MMDSLFGGLPLAFVYLNGIPVASHNMAEFLVHLEAIFSILAARYLVHKLQNSCFAQPAVKFLGHAVNAEGVLPLPAHVQ